jgi:hypothetical protein
MRTTIKTTAVLMLVLSLGLHWALLQTIAWTGMVISYSRDNPFREAVSMTFDGQHPCALCHVVKEGRAAEQDQEESLPVNKLPLADRWSAPQYCFDCDRESIPTGVHPPASRAEAPPKPRPRIPSPTGAA